MISPTALPFSLTLSIGDVNFNLQPSSPSSSSSPAPIVSVTRRGRDRHGGRNGGASHNRTADRVSDVVADLTNFSGTLRISSVAFPDDREDDHDATAAGKRRDDPSPRALCRSTSSEAANERIRPEESSCRDEQRVEASGSRSETRTPDDRLRQRLPPVMSGDDGRLRRPTPKCDGTAVSDFTGVTSWATFPIGKGSWGACAAAPNDGCALSADAIVGEGRNRAQRAGGAEGRSALQRGGRSIRSRSEPRTRRGGGGVDGTVQPEPSSQGGRRRRSKSRTGKSQESKSLSSKSSRRSGGTKTSGRSHSRSTRRRRDTNHDRDGSTMRRRRRAQSAPRSQRDFFWEASSSAASSSLHRKDQSSRNKVDDPSAGQCTAPPLLRGRSDGQSGQQDRSRSQSIMKDEKRRGERGGPLVISHASPNDAAKSKEGERSGLASSDRAPPPEDIYRALDHVPLNHTTPSDEDGSVGRRNWAELSIRERLLAEVDLMDTDADADADADKAESKRTSIESASSTYLDQRTGLQKRWSTLREQLLMEIENEMEETDLDTDGSKRSLTNKDDSDASSTHHIRRRRSSLVLRQRLLAEVAEMESESSLSCADRQNSTINGERLPLREWLLAEISEIDTSTDGTLDSEVGGDVCGDVIKSTGDGSTARVQALCADAKSSFEAFRSAVLGTTPPPPPEGTEPHQYPARGVHDSDGEQGRTSSGATGLKPRSKREKCDHGGASIRPSSRNESGATVEKSCNTGGRTGETELAEDAEMKEHLSHEAFRDEGGPVGQDSSEGPRNVGRRTESRLRNMLGEMHSLMSTTTNNHHQSVAALHKEQQTKSTVLSCASSQPTTRS